MTVYRYNSEFWGFDALYPPSAAVLHALASLPTPYSVAGGYLGGSGLPGPAWSAEDWAACRDAGFTHALAIWSPDFAFDGATTASDAHSNGQVDFGEAAIAMARMGLDGVPVLDTEHAEAGSPWLVPYVDGWLSKFAEPSDGVIYDGAGYVGGGTPWRPVWGTKQAPGEGEILQIAGNVILNTAAGSATVDVDRIGPNVPLAVFVPAPKPVPPPAPKEAVPVPAATALIVTVPGVNNSVWIVRATLDAPAVLVSNPTQLDALRRSGAYPEVVLMAAQWSYLPRSAAMDEADAAYPNG